MSKSLIQKEQALQHLLPGHPVVAFKPFVVSQPRVGPSHDQALAKDSGRGQEVGPGCLLFVGIPYQRTEGPWLNTLLLQTVIDTWLHAPVSHQHTCPCIWQSPVQCHCGHKSSWPADIPIQALFRFSWPRACHEPGYLWAPARLPWYLGQVCSTSHILIGHLGLDLQINNWMCATSSVMHKDILHMNG